MNQYKIYFANSETTLVAADDYEIKFLENEGQRRLVFTLEGRNIAVFNWSKIVGVQQLW